MTASMGHPGFMGGAPCAYAHHQPPPPPPTRHHPQHHPFFPHGHPPHPLHHPMSGHPPQVGELPHPHSPMAAAVAAAVAASGHPACPHPFAAMASQHYHSVKGEECTTQPATVRVSAVQQQQQQEQETNNRESPCTTNHASLSDNSNGSSGQATQQNKKKSNVQPENNTTTTNNSHESSPERTVAQSEGYKHSNIGSEYTSQQHGGTGHRAARGHSNNNTSSSNNTLVARMTAATRASVASAQFWAWKESELIRDMHQLLIEFHELEGIELAPDVAKYPEKNFFNIRVDPECAYSPGEPSFDKYKGKKSRAPVQFCYYKKNYPSAFLCLNRVDKPTCMDNFKKAMKRKQGHTLRKRKRKLEKATPNELIRDMHQLLLEYHQLEGLELPELALHPANNFFRIKIDPDGKYRPGNRDFDKYKGKKSRIPMEYCYWNKTASGYGLIRAEKPTCMDNLKKVGSSQRHVISPRLRELTELLFPAGNEAQAGSDSTWLRAPKRLQYAPK